MASAQPIALPSTSESNDVFMSNGSFMQPGSFNSQSFSRHLLGSPLSWRAGSFNRLYTGVSPGQLLGPLDPNDFKFGRTSSSIESDRGSIVNALGVFERQDELCRDYSCCGLNLTDLHALVEHFEECHVVVVDPYAPQVPMQSMQTAQQQAVSYFPEAGVPAPAYHQGSFDPDDMEMDMDQPSAPSSGAPSPPDTPISTPLSAYPSSSVYGGSAPASTCSSPHPIPISAFDTTTVLPSRSGHSLAAVGFPSSSRMVGPSQEPFSNYPYSDYSTLSSMLQPLASAAQMSVPPALLHSEVNTPESTPASSRVASPSPGTSTFRASHAGSSSAGSSSSANAARASTTLSRPATSLLLSKPFRCPKPNCNKSYKQANGLKYHMTHGSCNFAPPKDLEQIQQLLESKRHEKGKEPGEPISDAELREVEKEAERRLRPYACGVGDCQRRYKNMNGLRYHYQHSGDHGAIGLALLASGQHECLQHSKSRHSPARHAGSASTSAQQSPASSAPPTPTVSRAPSAAAAAPTYTNASALPPSYQSIQMQPPAYQQSQEPFTAVPAYLTSMQ